MKYSFSTGYGGFNFTILSKHNFLIILCIKWLTWKYFTGLNNNIGYVFEKSLTLPLSHPRRLKLFTSMVWYLLQANRPRPESPTLRVTHTRRIQIRKAVVPICAQDQAGTHDTTGTRRVLLSANSINSNNLQPATKHTILKLVLPLQLYWSNINSSCSINSKTITLV